jgi:KaiC/GvpD/RAD55 family RecA-like ATPase
MANIQLKVNRKLKLDIPEFLCDGGLGEHLDKYEMLKHLNGFRFTGLIGKPGSGKTSTLVSWLSGSGNKRVFRKVFNHVLLVMPPSSRASMKKNIFKKHDAGKMYDELDFSTASSIYDKLVASSEAKETSLLILDDVGAAMKNNEIQKILRKIVYNRRHLKVHIVVLLQSYLSVPKEVRKLFNNLVLFKPSKVEAENLFSELFEKKRDTSIAIINYVFTDAHDSLFLNVDSQKMYKNFDEVVVNESDD